MTMSHARTMMPFVSRLHVCRGASALCLSWPFSASFCSFGFRVMPVMVEVCLQGEIQNV